MRAPTAWTSKRSFAVAAAITTTAERQRAYENIFDLCPRGVRGLQMTVDGVAVVHRQGNIAAAHPWSGHLGAVWLYDVRFPAKRQVRIHHRYRVGQGAISDGTALGEYVTRTGALWARSIGRARFRIHVPADAHTAEAWVEGTGLSVTKHTSRTTASRLASCCSRRASGTPRSTSASTSTTGT